MGNKTYNQFCAVAHALDIVGERWTLLVVRNLLAGPKRFSDLMRGLPGISTNILTDRLKTLEAHAVITTRQLPPPAASTVYELTPAGYGLTGVLGALAQWGAQSIGPIRDGQQIVPESVVFMIQGMFWRDDTPDTSIEVVIYVEDNRYNGAFGVRVDKFGVSVSSEAIGDAPAGLTVSLDVLLLLSSGQLPLREALSTRQVEFIGARSAVLRVVEWVDQA
jgi:DNA-binding HxlR family transcriptional regulator